MDFKWSQFLTERLISQYEAQEHLYNHSMAAYKNRHMREVGLKEMLTDLRKFDNKICIEEIKKKINNLRTQYARERKKCLLLKQRGICAEEDFVSSLWCYDQLQFLNPHMNIWKADSLIRDKSNLDDTVTNDYSNDETLEGNDDPVRKKLKIQKKEPKIQYRIAEVERPATKLQQEKTNQSKMEYRFAEDSGHRHEEFLETDSTEPRLHEELIEIENPEQVLQAQVAEISNLLAKKSEKKYDWLGKEVVFEMNKITSESLQEEAAWAIQSILRSTLRKDRMRQQNFRQNQSHVTSSSRIKRESFRSLDEESIIDPLAASIEGIFDEEDC